MHPSVGQELIAGIGLRRGGGRHLAAHQPQRGQIPRACEFQRPPKQEPVSIRRRDQHPAPFEAVTDLDKPHDST